MAQIQKGYEYDSTDPLKNVVTDANLNSLVANATLLNGAITEQFPNSVTSDSDIMLLSKGGSLIKQTKGQFTDIINATTINTNLLNCADIAVDDIEINDSLLVGGNITITGTATITGGISGNTTINGNLTIGSGKTLTLDSAPTSNLHAATKAYVDSKPQISGYAKTSGTTIHTQVNIGSVTNPSVGTFTYTFTTPQANANYVINLTVLGEVNSGYAWYAYVESQTSSGFTIKTGYIYGDYGYTHAANPSSIYVSIFG